MQQLCGSGLKGGWIQLFQPLIDLLRTRKGALRTAWLAAAWQASAMYKHRLLIFSRSLRYAADVRQHSASTERLQLCGYA